MRTPEVPAASAASGAIVGSAVHAPSTASEQALAARDNNRRTADIEVFL
jgi:hypothetical protein